MTQYFSDFIPGSLEDTDKNIEVAYRYHVTAKQKGQLRIKVCNNNGYPFIAMFHNLLLEPDLCDRLFSIITLMNLGHNFLLHKGFCTMYFKEKEKMRVHYHMVHKGKNSFGGKSSKCQKQRNYYLERKLLYNCYIKD